MADREVAYKPISPFAVWRGHGLSDQERGLWVDARDRLRSLRSAATEVERDTSQEKSLLLAALQTGAVEGLHRMSRGVTETAVARVLDWEPVVEDEEGVDARRHVEAALCAYNLALDQAQQGARSITEVWLRSVHHEATAAQEFVEVRTPVGLQRQELQHGTHKQHANHVRLADGTMHWYCPPDEVPYEVRRLLDEIGNAADEGAHVIEVAAYAHHGLTAIHPFQDGNGRVARVLASVFLLRDASIPFHVYPDQVAEYWQSLAHADGADTDAFVRFVFWRAYELADYLSNDIEGSAELPIGAAERLVELDRRRRATERLQAELRAAVGGLYVGLDLSGVTVQYFETNPQVTALPDGRASDLANNCPALQLTASGLPAQFTTWTVVTNRAAEQMFPLGIHASGSGDVFDVRVSDVLPEVTQSFKLRLDAWLRKELAELIGRFTAQLDAE